VDPPLADMSFIQPDNGMYEDDSTIQFKPPGNSMIHTSSSGKPMDHDTPLADTSFEDDIYGEESSQTILPDTSFTEHMDQASVFVIIDE
jgi:hypothetical protein